MRISIEPAALAKALAAVNPLAPTARRQEEGDQVLLAASEDGLRLHSPQWGDPTRPAASAAIACSVEEPGDVWAVGDSRDLLKRLRVLFKGAEAKTPAELAVQPAGLYLGELKIADETAPFPYQTVRGEPEQYLRFPADKFQCLVKRFLPLSSTDYARPALTKFQVRVKPGQRPRFALTDSFQLGVERLAASETAAEGEFLVDRNLLRAGVRTPAQGDCLLGWSDDGQCQFLDIGALRLRLRSRLDVSGPNLDQLLDKFSRVGETVLADPHRTAERIKEIPLPDGAKNIPIFVRKTNGSLHAHYRDQEPVRVGEVKGGKNTWSAFEPGNLCQVLSAVPPSARRARLAFPEKVGKFNALTPMHVTAADARFLLMPARV